MEQLTTARLRDILGLAALNEADTLRPVIGGYCGDLLSRVMGRAAANCAWITIMDNLNTIAVASLADVACVILAEGVVPDAAVLERASAVGVNIYSSKKSAFELCCLCKESGVRI